MDDPEFGPDGQITRGGLMSHQRAWWNLTNFVRLLIGGYGSGKTFSISKRMVGLALHNAPCPVALISPTYKVARQTTIATIKELLQGKETIYGRKEFTWNWNQSQSEFTIHHGGRVGKLLIYSGENPDNLKGPNLAAAGIDEPFIQDYAVFTQMLARCRHPRARKVEINLSGTPEQLNWGYDLIEGELRGNYDIGYVRASTADNIALDPSFIERLRQAYDEKTAAAYIEGHFVNLTAGLVYYGFNPEEHIAELSPPPGAQLGCGMDFNVNPMAFTPFWHTKNHIHFFDEFELPNADTEEAIAELRKRYPSIREIYPDASGKQRSTSAPGGRSDFNILEAAGYNLNCDRRNPPVRDRFNAVNGCMKVRGGEVSWTVSPRCKRMRKYLLSYNHPEKNTDAGKEMSHLLDAMSYPVAYLFPVGHAKFAEKPLRGT